MKKHIILIGLSLTISSFQSFGQVYEKVYSESSIEVQNKMNQNKMSGIEILSDITAHHVIGISGIGITNKAALQTALNNEVKISAFTISDDMTSLIIDSKASYTKEDITLLIQPINGQIIGYSAIYAVSQ